MRQRERLVVSGVLAVLLVGWLGFFVHRSPRFPGSALGAAFGIAGAVLMLVPLAYVVVKRVTWLRVRAARRVSMTTLLAWHVWAGIFGPLLALVHTGHRFESPLGIALTTTMLIVVTSGWVGRYLLSYVGGERHDKTSLLVRLRMDLDAARRELDGAALQRLAGAPWWRGGWAWLSARAPGHVEPATRLLAIVEATADVEFALRSHAALERWFRRWAMLHIVSSVGLYVLLGLHVWSGIHFGLRWLR